MTVRDDSCVFCRPSQPALWRGRRVAALLDPAPIIEGHVLVYSSAHYPSAADVPAEVAAELDEVCDWARVLYHAEFGAYTMFEHGRTGHCVRRSPHERICHHLHIHMLPLAGDLTEQIQLGQRTGWRAWSDVAELASELDGYVVVETPVSGRSFFPVARTLEPHYLRTAAAMSVGDVARADWERIIGQRASAERVTSGSERLTAPFRRSGQSDGPASDHSALPCQKALPEPDPGGNDGVARTRPLLG